MAYYGIGIDPKIDTDTSLEEPSKTGLLSGAYQAAKLSFQNSFVSNEVTQFESNFAAFQDHGKWMSHDDYEDSEFKRPGINFPHGVAEGVARLAASKYDSKSASEEIMSNMNNGILPWSARAVGSAIGFAADPVNIGSTLLVPELVGVKSAETAYALSDLSPIARVKYIGTVAAKGAAEGALISTPSTLTQSDKEMNLGQSPDVLNYLTSIGTGAAIGGVVRGLGGAWNLISKDGFNAARSASINMAANDVVPDATPILRQAYNEARDAQPELKDVPDILPDDLSDEDKEKIKNEYGDIEDTAGVDTNLEAEQLLKNNPHLNVNFEDVKSNVDSMDDLDRDSAIMPGEIDEFYDDILRAADSPEIDPNLDAKIQALRDEEVLSDEDKEYFDNLESNDKTHTAIASALKSFGQCILGAVSE